MSLIKKWQDIIGYHLNSPAAGTFTRHPNVELSYRRHLKNNPEMKPYIVNNYLHNRLRWVITNNAFPYYLDNGIQHKILWINPQIEMDGNTVKSIIHRYAENMSYIYFENSLTAKSIPNILHYHIFIKKEEE